MMPILGIIKMTRFGSFVIIINSINSVRRFNEVFIGIISSFADPSILGLWSVPNAHTINADN